MQAADALAPAPTDVVRFFKLLADETRLAIVRLLALGDMRAGEVVEQLQTPANAVSYHFKQLRLLGLLRDRRSSLDARDVYYTLDLARLEALYSGAGATLHPGMIMQQEEAERLPTLERPLRVLFLCTHNRARSLMAEGFARYLAGEHVEAYSAGNHPSKAHPLTIEMLEEIGVDTSGMFAKSMDQFRDQRFDYIITTCDRVRESCPTFPDDPRQIHWSFSDPSQVEGGEEAQREAFRRTRREMLTRMRYLLSLPHPATGERIRLRSMSRFERGQA